LRESDLCFGGFQINFPQRACIPAIAQQFITALLVAEPKKRLGAFHTTSPIITPELM
jgi:hypothetical protein